jgi:hypothetical protein
MTRTALVLALALVAGGTHARPPADADPALAPWFEGLRAGNGSSCCSQADCRAVDYRIVDTHYEALIGRQFEIDPPRWVAVPETRILKPAENPVGRAVACWTPYAGILCFVLPSQV